MPVKANSSANLANEWVPFGPDARFVDGSSFDPNLGGVVRTSAGELWAIANRDSVPLGYVPAPEANGKAYVLGRRAAKIILSTEPAEGPLHTGAEYEFAAMNEDGTYAVIVDSEGVYTEPFANAGQKAPELYVTMGEVAVPPSASPEEAAYNLRTSLGRVASAASDSGLLIAPLAVYGQEADYQAMGNDHPYVAFIRTFMAERSGFDVANVFRVLGTQFHQEVEYTRFMMATGEAAQPFLPLWAAASFGGPFLSGGIERVIGDNLTPQQQKHIAELGFAPGDLRPGSASWRYVLRCLGSSSGGAWRQDIPTDWDGTVVYAHEKLRAGDIPTMDRMVGLHANLRPRYTLPGSRGTQEDCTPDTYAGNLPKITAAQLFYGASMHELERLVASGEDPRDKYPDIYGGMLGHPKGHANHRRNLDVFRGGMEAGVNRKKVYAHFPDLARLATKGGAPEYVVAEMRKSYVSDKETEAAIRQWMRDTGAKLPSMQAYYDTGIGAPYVYMRARAEALREKQPYLTEDEIIRNCELDMAVTFMRQWE
jgi:hypothetical protein